MEIIRKFNFFLLQNFWSYSTNFKKIYIIGYSFGGVLGLELAKLFETEGKKTTFISIDGSFRLIKKYVLKSLKNQTSNEDLENWLFIQFGFEIKPGTMKTLLNGCDTEQKSEKLANMAELKKYSKNFIKISFQGILNRLKSILNFQNDREERKLNSGISLIRPNIGLLNDISDDYELKLCTNNDVKICYSDKRHLTLLEDVNVRQFIKELCNSD